MFSTCYCMKKKRSSKRKHDGKGFIGNGFKTSNDQSLDGYQES